MKHTNLLVLLFLVGCSDVGNVKDTSKTPPQESNDTIEKIEKIDETIKKDDSKDIVDEKIVIEKDKNQTIQTPEKPYKNPFQPNTEIDPNIPKYIEPALPQKEYLNEKELKTLPTNISQDMKLTKNIYWKVKGNVKVESGVKIEIEAGTEIFFTGSTSNIIFSEGSQLIAMGKKNSPIIFTSENDILGNEAKAGEWGGLDFRGGQLTFKYIQIRYGGYNRASLKLENIQYSSILEFIEIYISHNDGIKIVGGEVNLRNSIILGANGDSLSVKNWSGNIQNLYIHQFNGVFGETSSGLEIGSGTDTTITNLTINSDSEKAGAGIYIREKSNVNIINSIISGKRAGVSIKSQEISDTHFFQANVLNSTNGNLENIKLDKTENILLSENTALDILAKKIEPINPYSINNWFDEYSQLYIGAINFNINRKWSDDWSFGMEESLDEKK